MAAITGAILKPAQLKTEEATSTPSAFSATQARWFASTVNGAVLMGYGTTGDVTLKNRAGTSVAWVVANTTTFQTAGALTVAGAVSGVTTLAASGTITATKATGGI